MYGRLPKPLGSGAWYAKYIVRGGFTTKNIAKGTTDPRVEFISQVQTQIFIKFHLQNLDSASTRNLNQTSVSPLNLKFKILTQPSFRISTKIQLHNLYKTSATKCWTSFSFKIGLGSDKNKFIKNIKMVPQDRGWTPLNSKSQFCQSNLLQPKVTKPFGYCIYFIKPTPKN